MRALINGVLLLVVILSCSYLTKVDEELQEALRKVPEHRGEEDLIKVR